MIRTRHHAVLWCSVLMKVVAAVLLIRGGIGMLHLLWVWWQPSHLMSELELVQGLERFILYSIVPSSVGYAASVVLLLVVDIESNTRRLLEMRQGRTFGATPLQDDPLPQEHRLG